MDRRDRESTARATGLVELLGSDERGLGGEREAERYHFINRFGGPDRDERPLFYVAVVHGVREIHFVIANTYPSALFEQLCDRLAQDAPDQLWDEDGRAFLELRREGRFVQAVEFYFREVGERWDPAWLSVQTVCV